MKKSLFVFFLIVCFLSATFPAMSFSESLSDLTSAGSTLNPETKTALRKLESRNPSLLSQKAGCDLNDSSNAPQSQVSPERVDNPRKDTTLLGIGIVLGAVVGVVLAAGAALAHGIGAGGGGSC